MQMQMKTMSVKSLFLMAGLHFISMFILMYSMVNTIGNVYPNLNFVYMAALMTAPMLILEVWLMGHMYTNKVALKIIMGIGIFLLLISFVFIRQQTLVYDREFIRSMIPHHSGAILMCRQAQLEDNELKTLCQSIINSQQEEINQMQRILTRLD